MGIQTYRFLSKPMKVLFLEPDDFVIVFAFFLGGIMGYKILWLAGGIVLYYYMKAKKSKPRGYLGHWFYQAGILTLDRYPSPYQRRFYE